MSLETWLYAKECLGKDGIPIRTYKFRSMDANAEERLDEILSNGLDSYGHIINDPRVTPLGRFLRKYCIDELPQFYNLTKGDLKLVGIRPKGTMDWERYPEDIKIRALRQKPSLIGVSYAYKKTSSFEDHLAYHREYLDQWEASPNKTDLKYLLRIMMNIAFRGVRSS